MEMSSQLLLYKRSDYSQMYYDIRQILYDTSLFLENNLRYDKWLGRTQICSIENFPTRKSNPLMHFNIIPLSTELNLLQDLLCTHALRKVRTEIHCAELCSHMFGIVHKLFILCP